MDVLKVDLNQAENTARPVVNVEIWDELPADTDDFLYFVASEHGGVGVGYTWSEVSESFSPPMATTTVQTQPILAAVRCADLALPLGPAKFVLSLDGLEHGATGPRAFFVSFSTDDCATFGAPTRVSLPVEANTAVDLSVELYRSLTVAKSATSSALGELGAIVPAGANGIRVGVAVGGELRDDITAGTVILSGATQ